jgi:hypothetical protein
MKRNAEASIERGQVVIRVPIKNLPLALKAGIDLGYIDPGVKITNAQAFAKDLVRALNDEDEEGTTPIHRLLDEAITEAIEQGAEGVTEDDSEAA